MLEAQDAESQERKKSHGGQGCLLQPAPPDFYGVYSTTGVLRGLCSMQVWGQLHGQSCLPWHSSTHSQRQSGDTLAAGITCLLPAGPCTSCHVSASSLKPDSRSPSKLKEALRPIFSQPAMGVIASRWWWLLLHLHLFESCAQPKSISHKGWYQPVLEFKVWT